MVNLLNVEKNYELERLKSEVVHYNTIVQWADKVHLTQTLEDTKKEYLSMLKPMLNDNQWYCMDLHNNIKGNTDVVDWLNTHIIKGTLSELQYHYHFDKSIHKDLDTEDGFWDKAEIIECLYASEWLFYVSNNKTYIVCRPWNGASPMNIVIDDNIFNTDLILNLSITNLQIK